MMLQPFNRLLQAGLMVLSLVCYLADIAAAETTPSVPSMDLLTDDLSRENSTPNMDRVTSVAELADVQPTDWAYQALQTLVDRYGVVIGYPDQRFRGNQPMSRAEFAAGLNAAMVHINEVLDSELAQYARKEDLEILQRLQQQFANDLAVAKVEFSAENLANNLDRFRDRALSTTTKLSGEAIFAASFVAPGEKVDGSNEPIDSNITFGNRIKLDLETSFTGKDRLITSLKTGNLPEMEDATGTDMARVAFQGDRGNQLELDELTYRFPWGDRARIRLIAIGGSLTDFARSLNPLLDDTGEGALSRFGQRNPIYRQGGGSGIGITYKFNDAVTLSLGYLARNASNLEVGLNKSPYGAIAQLTASPTDGFDLAVTYIRSYNSIDTRTGSEIANDPFRDRSDAVIGNSIGFQSQLNLSSQVFLSGWVGWTRAIAKDIPGDPKASILNWAMTLAVTDLGKTGNLLGIVVGQPPKTIANQFIVRRQNYIDVDTSLHLEIFYQWKVVDNLSLTLGLITILNPEHNRNTPPLYLGTLRSTFSF